MKHRCSSLEELCDIARRARHDTSSGEVVQSERPSQPRWVRVNTLKTNIEEQLQSSFSGYSQVETLEHLITNIGQEAFCIDEHVPNLLAIPSSVNLTKSSAYLDGKIILQDKASCFPAYLLDPLDREGDIVDACAAPGNKTTHLATLVDQEGHKSRIIHACERDKTRASLLAKMVGNSGALKHVMVHAGQDFLGTDPCQPPWNMVSALLLDPSCSGSGMIGRDQDLEVVLPKRASPVAPQGKKRKRGKLQPAGKEPIVQEILHGPVARTIDSAGLEQRLKSLSVFQLKLLLHAFSFPQARRITYSTCSIYEEENESVVVAALSSDIARTRGWRILRREEQVDGMRKWHLRGQLGACKKPKGVSDWNASEIAEACIRCEKGTKDGTQGFFVVGFIRGHDLPKLNTSQGDDMSEVGDDFNGFDD